MVSTERRLDDRLEVRVDPAFKARLKAAAKADHRSLSSFVISRLEAALSSSETPEPATRAAARNAVTDHAYAVHALVGKPCRTCERNGPPKTRPCAKCGHQR